MAVVLPPEQQHALAARLDAHFADIPMPGRKVHPSQWPITLRFLGDVGKYQDDRVSLVESILEASGPKYQVVDELELQIL